MAPEAHVMSWWIIHHDITHDQIRFARHSQQGKSSLKSINIPMQPIYLMKMISSVFRDDLADEFRPNGSHISRTFRPLGFKLKDFMESLPRLHLRMNRVS
jgi:hypothetical protein